MKNKMIVVVDGGLVVDILSTEEIPPEIIVVDKDTEGADENEIMSKEEIDKFVGKDIFKSIKYDRAISDADI